MHEMMCHLSNKEIREDTLQIRATSKAQRVPTADEGRRVSRQRGGCATRQPAAGAWNADDTQAASKQEPVGENEARAGIAIFLQAGRTLEH